MKITKRPIKADEFIDETLVPVDEVVDDIGGVPEDIAEEATICPYNECIEYIHQAIDCLAACEGVKDDPVAKEAIANLSVVLLSLQ